MLYVISFLLSVPDIMLSGDGFLKKVKHVAM